MQRKVLQPYTFGDGSFIPKGNLVCVPQQALMRDSNNYPDPTKFDPTRYLVLDDDQTLRAMPRFTDVKMAFPYWGAPKRAWLVPYPPPFIFSLYQDTYFNGIVRLDGTCLRHLNKFSHISS